MAKDIPKDVEGHSVGNRTTRDNGGAEAWQLGGRKEESKFDPNLAALHAAAHAARQQKG